MADNSLKNKAETKQLKSAENRPLTIYETASMSEEEIEAKNLMFKKYGIASIVIDVSKFKTRLDVCSDGSFKRHNFKHKIKNET